MCPKTWQDIPLERNLYGHPLAALLWARQFEKVLLGNGNQMVMFFGCIGKWDSFVPCTWTMSKW